MSYMSSSKVVEAPAVGIGQASSYRFAGLEIGAKITNICYTEMLALGFLRSRDSPRVENVHRAKALVGPQLEERIAEAQPGGRRA